MKYSNFEELPVWNAAIQFALRTYDFTNKGDFRGLGDTKNQLERAALSISNNIAEGFERGTTAELITFLYIAKGSSGECRSILRLCEHTSRFENFRSEISNLIGQAQGISKQLNGWIESLKNTDIRGPRYLNDKERVKSRQKREFDEFDHEMAKYKRELEEKLRQRELDAARRYESDAKTNS